MSAETGALLERDSTLASLHGYAAQARAGNGRLVLVAGEAGVGKSALIERFQRELPDSRWWWGTCDGLFTPRPLGPLLDLADQFGGRLAELCRAGADREKLFHALLLELSPADALDVVVIEDVHWADDATLDLLRHLGRRLRDLSVLLVATYRDDALPAGHPLRLVLGDLASSRYTRRVDLKRLSPRSVARLAAGSGLAATELYRLTGGNPFYLTEILGAAARAAGGVEVPASARDAVLARAAQLSGPAREVLDAAALAGTRVELRLLAAILDSPLSTVDELVAGGLVSGDGHALRFRHEIGRLAVAQAVPAHRVRSVHRRMLSALHAAGCDDEARLAFHAEAAGDAAAVLRHAPAAARQAAELASHREAAAQYERALRFAEAADPASRAGLYQGFADEAAVLDRWQEAQAAAERALALWRAVGDRLGEGDTLRRLARIQRSLCRGAEAAATAREAVATLAPLGPSVELAWAYAALAHLLLIRTDYPAAVEAAQRAAGLAVRFGATEVLSAVTTTLGICAVFNGAEWAGLLRQALDMAVTAGHHDQAGRAYTNLGAAYVLECDFAAAERYLAEGAAYCAEHDVTAYAAGVRGDQVSLLERTGRWDEALALCTRQLDTVAPRSVMWLYLSIHAGILRARRGEPDAWSYLDEAVPEAERAGEAQQQLPVRLARAEAYWLDGRQPEARREAELADDVSAHAHAWQRGAVAAWLARTGSTRPARGPIPEPYRLLRDGEHVRAAEAWIRLGCPYEAGLALTDATDEAPVRRGLGILTQLGAGPAVRVARRRLRALGARSVTVGPRTSTRADPLGLTRRERDVLDLLRVEHTNAEIAAKLFISPRTVDHHVSAILAKLRVSTRAAAVARLEAAAAGTKHG
jgi:DNA-binding CsgD family transcriptional regulator/tetratricopeptide (TPR) repeat protein